MLSGAHAEAAVTDAKAKKAVVVPPPGVNFAYPCGEGSECVNCEGSFSECPDLSYNNLKAQATVTAEPSNCLGACQSQSCDTSAALALCVKPSNTAEYYIGQANQYFDTLDPMLNANAAVNYFVDVIRFEWSPWLLFTGYGAETLANLDAVNAAATPFSTPHEYRDCTYHDENPFVRCSVALWASGYKSNWTANAQANAGLAGCGIYEEFTFNAAGQVTFVEAWSATLPKQPRMSNRIPGLGSTSSKIDQTEMAQVAQQDPDVAYLNSFFQSYLGVTLSQATQAAAILSATNGGFATEMTIGCTIDSEGMPVYK